MIREILFKAKRKDSNEWVEGYYAKLGYGKNVKHFIIQNVFLQEDISYFEDIEINPSTLSQYTGLNDNTKWDDLTELEKELFLSSGDSKEFGKKIIIFHKLFGIHFIRRLRLVYVVGLQS